jgi:hypothetical protein
MPRIHNLLSGIRVEYPDPTPELDTFLRELAAMAERPTTISELIGFAHGPANPLLEEGLIPGRPAVTRAVLARPEWRVAMDFVDRGWLKITGEPAERLGEAYTVTVAELAKQAGVSEGAIRAAISAGTLRAWVRDGRYYLTPEDADAYSPSKAGPKRRPPAALAKDGLTVRCGHTEGAKLLFRADAPFQATERGGRNTKIGTIPQGAWTRAEVLRAEVGKPGYYAVIEPANTRPENEIVGAAFHVLGGYKIVKEITGVNARHVWLDNELGLSTQG